MRGGGNETVGLPMAKMDPKHLRSELERGIARAWEGLTEGWREMLSGSSGALTRFRRRASNGAEGNVGGQFPSWSLLQGECWETAQSVIVRVEVPGMNKDDLDVSIQGSTLHIRGEKHSEGEHTGRRYLLMERAYGRFERTVPLPDNIDRKHAEVTYQSGVVTVIVPKTETLPPERLTVR
jgi:HSP20 family protein